MRHRAGASARFRLSRRSKEMHSRSRHRNTLGRSFGMNKGPAWDIARTSSIESEMRLPEGKLAQFLRTLEITRPRPCGLPARWNAAVNGNWFKPIELPGQ